MYGQPLNPRRTSFGIAEEDGNVVLYVLDLDEPDNDDVRDIDHPDFDYYWGNACENVFELWKRPSRIKRFRESGELKPLLSGIEQARMWCRSIGMIEDPTLVGAVGG